MGTHNASKHGSHHLCSEHAEMNCYRKAVTRGFRRFLRGAFLVVARNDGGCAMPCQSCQRFIDKYHITVYHTDT